MDPEEVRRRRREKILARSGVVEKKEEEPVQVIEELTPREKLEVIEGLEKYKNKVRSIKVPIIILLSIIAAYYATIKTRYMVFSFFISAIVPYTFITEISYGIITPDVPLNTLEKAARTFKVFKDFFGDIFLYLGSLILSISAWSNILS